jgi:hypothetical protein
MIVRISSYPCNLFIRHELPNTIRGHNKKLIICCDIILKDFYKISRHLI